jgi:hypothetical protein
MFSNGVNASSEEMDGAEFGSQPGRPTTAKSNTNVEKARTLLWSDRRLAVNRIAEEMNINRVCTIDFDG